jgi:hypothetical protein
MGQYLAIAMTTSMRCYKGNVEKHNITKQRVVKELGIGKSMVEVETSPDYWEWELTPQILEAELFKVLKQLYESLYDNDRHYKSILERLSKLPIEKWLDYEEEDYEEDAFQTDDIRVTYSFSQKGKDVQIDVRESVIIVALEGKISMETYGMMFDFFEQAVQNQFKKFQLGKLLRIFITG